MKRILSLAAVVLACVSVQSSASADSAPKPAQTDFPALVSAADLKYDKPANRSEAGMPIGNGRMGSLIWTTPTAMKFQINRCDVFAEDGTTDSFPERHTDYSGGCGYVDVNFVDYGDDVFPADSFHQHLSCYDGVVTTQGKGITTRTIAWHDKDVIAIEVDDQRPQPSPISVDLRMLRYAMEYIPGENYALASHHTVLVQHRDQSAASTLNVRDGRIALTQVFREGKFYDSSAVVIGVIGRQSQARYLNDSTVRLTAAPGQGKFTILIASAASFNADDDVEARATKAIDAAAEKQFDGLLADNQDWWKQFWSRGYVRLHSDDGEAQFVEQNYNYFLYLMNSCSLGDYPPRFGGLLWNTNGDMREWGSQYWWANMGCYYNGLQAANRLELMLPVFNMYSKMYDASATAARQEWDSKGIYIPETVFFDGLETLPDDLASEMADLYLGRKPWDQRSPTFNELADVKNGHNSRWNWKNKGKWIDGHFVWKDRGDGPRGPVVTILSSGAKIAYLYWLQYQYTQDQSWLRDRAYPMLKGYAEFYRNFPNVKKGPDGQYHIHNVNNHEPVWGATDTMEEMCAMYGIFPLAIRASQILNVDLELRASWQEFLDHLAPLPKLTEVPKIAGGRSRWIAAVPPAVYGNPLRPDLLPALQYDLCTVGREDRDMQTFGRQTYDVIYPDGVNAKTPVSVLNTVGTAAAHLGLGEDLRYILPNQIRCLAPDHDFCDFNGSGREGVMMNRLTLREGPGAIDAERLGRVAEALHDGLLQSVPPAPGGDPVIYVFPAWPKEWDADYSLLARGAFVVSSSIRSGTIAFVRIESQAGGECRVHNPWPGSAVTVDRKGSPEKDLSGTMLRFETHKGEVVTLAPKQ